MQINLSVEALIGLIGIAITLIGYLHSIWKAISRIEKNYVEHTVCEKRQEKCCTNIMKQLKGKALLLIAALSMALIISGCQALNTLAGNTAQKNIATGSDTWGGDIEASLTGTTEAAPCSISLWFGRRRVWYASLKETADCKYLPEIIKTSNSAVGISAGPTGVKISQSSSPDSNAEPDSGKVIK